MSDRIEVLKTYKTYIGGRFPRTESGRSYKVYDKNDNLLANACQCSRKDVRDAVVAARSSFEGWAGRSAYNRGQILYRIAEMLETRKVQFIDELQTIGYASKEAKTEVESSIDRLIYYAGWADKYQQVFGSINPVAGPHFNFSMLEPTGVVFIWAQEEAPLLGLITAVAPVIIGGNACVALASQKYPLSAISFAEVLNSSDVPGGIVNILTGFRDELLTPMTSHMDVNAFFYSGSELDQQYRKQIGKNAALNVKRFVHKEIDNWQDQNNQSPYYIIDFQETKTTWHPVGL